ncbi:transposase [Pseudoflavitalea sp. X16]|uniref:transposase n=1 Tax=Paraflavitalea devenefica TaxID=2716334 RepID=UPI0014228706|nr:transposase [Paraflavitalea devenefica]NII24385.1 transposase [Paraflavitalea devenefica]
MKQDEKNSVTNQHACHYLTFNTVDWVDVFIKPRYKQLIANTLNEFITLRGLTVFAWCLMTNHLHLLLQAKDGTGLSMIERDFKRVTATRILEAIDMEPELRREWMLGRFEHSSQTLKKIEKYQVWQSCSNPEFLDFKQPAKVRQYLNYIHENPVRDRIVYLPEDYMYSSAGDYAGRKGPVQVTVIDMEGLIRGVVKGR